MSPPKDGFEVCRELRAAGSMVPVLMLTARDAVQDRIAGLDLGADDYLVKPFDFHELLARVRALLRRGHALRPETLTVADLVIDTRAQQVRRGDRQIELTAKEYALLEYLARRAGEVVSRADIAEHVWDESFDLELLGGILIVAVPFALLGVAAIGWFLARKSLAPVVAMPERARRISAENLDQRLPVINPRDELGQLATIFNELLARLNEAFQKQQEAFAQQRQFMADASHELRTPLYVMRTAGEVTMDQEQCEASEYREALAMINQQTRHLTRIVEDMFTLARADAGQRKPEYRTFYLDELVTEAARAAQLLAERKGVKVEIAPADETPYRGDEGLLRQMLLNLLDNAVKYTPAGGAVRVSLAQHDSMREITVTDTGAGIPPEAQSRIFERFYRADKSRTRTETCANGGAGLGLSIARWIAEAHHGCLELRHSDQRGSTFVATLPAPTAG
jgi:heavy metal sensor kinase